MTRKNELIPKAVKILDKRQESPDIFTFKLDIQMDYKPGQFMQVSVLGVGEAPISISSYSKKFLNISVRTVGNVTNVLALLKKGDMVHVRGPYGNGYDFEKHAGKDLILVGGGCGVAPLKGIIDYVEANRKLFGEVYLFLGYRSSHDVIFKKELNKWKDQYHVEVAVEKKTPHSCYVSQIGYITPALEKFIMKKPEKCIVGMCGPPMLMKISADILNKKGVKYNQMYLSEERLMQCGVGQCCHCMIRGEFVCMDGPVFNYADINNLEND